MFVYLTSLKTWQMLPALSCYSAEFSGVIPPSGKLFHAQSVGLQQADPLLARSSANLLAHVHEADQIAEPILREVFILFL